MPIEILKLFTKRKFLKYVLSLISSCLLILVLLQNNATFLDYYLYDLNFQIRSPESTDSRIVMVEWDEKSIQSLEETTISDSTLGSLLTKIERQNPSNIGLDLYRDVPVFSPLLTDEENTTAYRKLQNIFSSSDNLIGIEKAIAPIVNPPKILKELDRVGSSDLTVDLDGFVRRSRIFPHEDEESNPFGVAYIGTRLGYEYLASHGWTIQVPKDVDPKVDPLKMVKDGKSMAIKPLPDRTVFSPKHFGTDFLINWRKADRPFQTVSVIDIVTNNIPSNLFKDRLAIVGNVAHSSADRHDLSLNRWDKEQTWRYGVYIPAHVASSIINAAFNQRKLISLAPAFIQHFLIFLSAASLILVYYFFQDSSIKKFLTIEFSVVALLTAVLLAINFTSFKIGNWIPSGKALTILWISSAFTYIYHIYQVNRKNQRRIKLAIDSHQDYLFNKIEAISLSHRGIIRDSSDLEILYGDFLEVDGTNKLMNEFLTTLAEKLETIRDNSNNIESDTLLLQKSVQQQIDILRHFDSPNTISLKSYDINDLTKNLIFGHYELFLSQQEKGKKNPKLIFKSDPSLQNCFLDREIFEKSLINIFDNALLASFTQANINSLDTSFQGQVKVLISRKNNYIEFEIIDNGIGLPFDKNIDTIFEPFMSLGQGQGNGLYIAKTYLNKHKGKITVQKLSLGTKFTILFPLLLNKKHFTSFLPLALSGNT